MSTVAAPPIQGNRPFVSKWSSRYRGATVEDLEPPAALSVYPSDTVSAALLSAFERDYTHLTVVDRNTRALLGYVHIPHLQVQHEAGHVGPADPVERAMTRFRRRGRPYTVITLETPLEALEEFFFDRDAKPVTDAVSKDMRDFAVITDDSRRFVLGVATRQDLEEFVRRRPA